MDSSLQAHQNSNLLSLEELGNLIEVGDSITIIDNHLIELIGEVDNSLSVLNGGQSISNPGV